MVGWGAVALIALALTACSRSAEPQPPAAQQSAPAPAPTPPKSAAEQAWDAALVIGSIEAFNQYLQRHADGAHAVEARARIAALEQLRAEAERVRAAKARREADDKAFADAAHAGTIESLTRYLRDFADGAHVADARAKLAPLERAETERQRAEQARREAELRAEQERQRAEQARREAEQRAETERQRAEQERQRAEQARREAEQRAEAERQRVEQARRETEQRAEQERQRTEQARRETEQRAEQERQRTEQARREAEQERQRTEEARKAADDKAFGDALRLATAEALTGYIKAFSAGAHLAEARQRLAALEQQRAEQARREAEQRAETERREAAARAEATRKAADDEAFRTAEREANATAWNRYLQEFPNGAHAAYAKVRLATLEQQRAQAEPAQAAAPQKGGAKALPAAHPRTRHDHGKRPARKVRRPYPCPAVSNAEPPLGFMRESGRLCVTDKSCPPGLVKLVIGGRNLDFTNGEPRDGGRARRHLCVRAG